jgi:hypothetical protein
MNVIMFKAQGTNLLMKADIPREKLEEIRKDIHRAIAIKALEAYMSYDDDGGVTITLIFDKSNDARNN